MLLIDQRASKTTQSWSCSPYGRAGWPKACALPETCTPATRLQRCGLGLQRRASGSALRRLRPTHQVGAQPINPSSRDPQLRGGGVPGSPAACPGRQGGVISHEEENLSRKFVPINIPVPGSSSPAPRAAPGRGQGGPCSCSYSRRSTAGPRQEAKGQLLGAHARGGGRTCSDARGARAQRLAPEDPEAQTKPRAGRMEREERKPCLGEGCGSPED